MMIRATLLATVILAVAVMFATPLAAVAATPLAAVQAATAQAPVGTPAPTCDRACLTGIADTYMAALVAHDPSRVPWAKHVTFTENSVPMSIGDGLWNTITKLNDYKIHFADPEAGQVGFYGVIEESGVPQVYGMRLKVEQGAVSEVETVVARTREKRPDFPNAAGLKVPSAVFSQSVPASKRVTREELIRIANSYFETLQQNDGTIKAPFAKTCDRVEDGVHTTNNAARAAGSGNGFPQWGCEAQFKTGFFHFVTSVRDRRFPLVDVERGLVLVSTFFDHAGTLRTVTLTDGATRHIGPPFNAPYSFVIFELFKIADGKIQRVEAVLEDVPYKTRSLFADAAAMGTSGVLAPAIGARPRPETPSAVQVIDCDRTCLYGFADRYMAALVAHDPTRLPWSADAKFTENNVPLKPGDGLWGTIDKQGAYKLYFADAAVGQVGFYGTVEEDGSPSIFSLRLKIAAHAIAEAETIVVRQATNTFGDANALRDQPLLNETVSPADRETRERLVTTANSYFETLQQNNGSLYAQFDPKCHRIENGVATTNNPGRPDRAGVGIAKMGCIQQFQSGYFRYVTRIRDRRFLVVDPEKGLIFASAFFDHTGGMKQETLADGRVITPQFTIPWTWLIGELFRVKDGKLIQVEALVLKVPYNTVSSWK